MIYLLVPGIFGSKMDYAGGGPLNSVPLWGGSSLFSSGVSALLDLLDLLKVNPDESESRPTRLAGIVKDYAAQLRHFRTQFDPPHRCFQTPYDWRFDPARAANQIMEQVNGIEPSRADGEQYCIVAHSYGGLVAGHLADLLGNERLWGTFLVASPVVNGNWTWANAMLGRWHPGWDTLVALGHLGQTFIGAVGLRALGEGNFWRVRQKIMETAATWPSGFVLMPAALSTLAAWGGRLPASVTQDMLSTGQTRLAAAYAALRRHPCYSIYSAGLNTPTGFLGGDLDQPTYGFAGDGCVNVDERLPVGGAMLWHGVDHMAIANTVRLPFFISLSDDFNWFRSQAAPIPAEEVNFQNDDVGIIVGSSIGQATRSHTRTLVDY